MSFSLDPRKLFSNGIEKCKNVMGLKKKGRYLPGNQGQGLIRFSKVEKINGERK